MHKEHHCKNREDFNKYFTFTIIQHCVTSSLDVNEHKWMIHRLKTFEPGGLTQLTPFQPINSVIRIFLNIFYDVVILMSYIYGDLY